MTSYAIPLVLIVYLVGVLTLRRWYRCWGATLDEQSLRLPGDEFLEPGHSTRAITINASAECVWAWLVQIGQDRAGFYSYTWLENLFLAGMRNANTIHPEWQIKRGDCVRLASRRVYGDLPLIRVLAAEKGSHLALEKWGSFVLRPVSTMTTRLYVRTTHPPTNILGWATYVLLLEPAHFVMERGMMIGIKRRAERRSV